MNKNNFQPFNSTFPMQDNFGQPIVSFGINKLEWASIMIAGHIAANATADMLDETIVNYSIDLAQMVLNECGNRLDAITESASPSIITNAK